MTYQRGIEEQAAASVIGVLALGGTSDDTTAATLTGNRVNFLSFFFVFASRW